MSAGWNKSTSYAKGLSNSPKLSSRLKIFEERVCSQISQNRGCQNWNSEHSKGIELRHTAADSAMKTVQQGQAMLKLKPIDTKSTSESGFIKDSSSSTCGSWITDVFSEMWLLCSSDSRLEALGWMSAWCSLLSRVSHDAYHELDSSAAKMLPSSSQVRNGYYRAPARNELVLTCWNAVDGLDFRYFRTGKRSRNYSLGSQLFLQAGHRALAWTRQLLAWLQTLKATQQFDAVVQVDVRIQGEGGVPKKLGHNQWHNHIT